MDLNTEAFKEVGTNVVDASSAFSEARLRPSASQPVDVERSNRQVKALGFPDLTIVEAKKGSVTTVRPGEAIIRNADGNVTSVTRPDGRTIDVEYAGKGLKAVNVESGKWTKDTDGKGWTLTDSTVRKKATAQDIQVRTNGDLVIRDKDSGQTERPDGSSQLKRADGTVIKREASGHTMKPQGQVSEPFRTDSSYETKPLGGVSPGRWDKQSTDKQAKQPDVDKKGLESPASQSKPSDRVYISPLVELEAPPLRIKSR